MAFSPLTWIDRATARKFTKSAETSTNVTLTQDPGTITQAGTAFNAANMNRIEIGVAQAHWYGTTSNAGNAYSITLSPVPTLADLTGLPIRLKINTNASGAVTLNINLLGAKSVKTSQGASVANWKSNAIVTVVYNGTDFIEQGGGSDGNAIPANLLAGKTADVITGPIVGTMVDRSLAHQAGIAEDGTATAGRIYLYGPAGYYSGVNGVYWDDPDFIAANIRADQNMFGLQGSMPNNSGAYQGPVTFNGSFQPNRVYLNVPYGFYDGASPTSYNFATDPNFISANIPTGMSMFGLAGSGANAKYYASGTLTSSAFGVTIGTTNSSGGANALQYVTVSGLNFPNGIGAIIIRRVASSDFTLYQRNELRATGGVIFQGGGNEYIRYGGSIFASATGFLMPVVQVGVSYTWEA